MVWQRKGFCNNLFKTATTISEKALANAITEETDMAMGLRLCIMYLRK